MIELQNYIKSLSYRCIIELQNYITSFGYIYIIIYFDGYYDLQDPKREEMGFKIYAF